MPFELHATIISAVRQNPSCINKRIVGDRRLVDPDSVGPDVHLTPLAYAVVMNDEELVRELLDLGADIETRDSFGSTPLMMAAYNKRRAISRLLVQCGADLTAVSANGKTVLHCAAQYGDIELVEQVLDAGVSVNAADFEGYTALHCSLINDQVESVEILLKHGADPMLRTSVSARTGANRSARDFAESFSKRSIARLTALPQGQPKQWWRFWR